MAHILKIPTATYRLQFNKSFTFKDARKLVPYLQALGISHIYASPYFKAAPGSPHGYDICDHNELNPEIGTRADYDALVAELHAHGMGQIVDFVPNHMGIGTPLNVWWMDVLENGPASIYASHFDIDWHPIKKDLENKVLLPVLGEQYGRVLERGELKLDFESGAFFVRYFDMKLPLAPRSCVRFLKRALQEMRARGVGKKLAVEMENIATALEEDARDKEAIKRHLAQLCEECATARKAICATLREIEGRVGEPRSFDAFDELLNEQAYRLSFWRVASEEINYRRFFEINNLAAIRVELPDVFKATHRLLFELTENRSLDGVRIDHVDGLWHPRAYLENLQRRAAELLGHSASARPLYLLVEKILLGDETLRADWPVHGTTGYDFVNEVTGLFVDSSAEKSLTETYRKFTGMTTRFDEIAYRKKQLVMKLALASEINVLGQMLDRLSEKNRWYRDFTLNALTDAVREVIACFPVYRTYVAPGEEPSDADREAILRAVRLAKRRNPGIERSVFNFLGEILLMKFPENIDEAAQEEHMRFVMKFQQCTGPIMAKGVEDTAFYIDHRLVALNEVGGDPQCFGMSLEKFCERCAARLARHPHALLATSTHDTKRSEDVRARIAAISEMPSLWKKSLRRWQTLNRRHKREIEGEPAPDANEEYLLYQTLLGTWPLEPLSHEAHEHYIQRIQDYMIKAIKEAKVNTSWIQPNEEWETAVREFVAGILRRGRNRFMKNFEALAAPVAQLGATNALAQLVLKCSVPGVPDFYQGSELWEFSLVDPDNRRPVDYELRQRSFDTLASIQAAEFSDHWRDGRIKLFVTQTLLNFRRQHPLIFECGDFIPLHASGVFAECCVSFVRRMENEWSLVIVPRLTHRLGFPAVGDAWRDTTIELPADQAGKPLRELFTGAELNPNGAELSVANALRVWPVAVCTTLGWNHRDVP